MRGVECFPTNSLGLYVGLCHRITPALPAFAAVRRSAWQAAFDRAPSDPLMLDGCVVIGHLLVHGHGQILPNLNAK